MRAPSIHVSFPYPSIDSIHPLYLFPISMRMHVGDDFMPGDTAADVPADGEVVRQRARWRLG